MSRETIPWIDDPIRKKVLIFLSVESWFFFSLYELVLVFESVSSWKSDLVVSGSWIWWATL